MTSTNTRHTKQKDEYARPTSPVERAALASISDGVVVNDTEGRVTVLNRTAARMLQADPDAVRGQLVETLFEPFSARGRLTIAEALTRLRADPYSYGHGKPAETIVEIGMRFIQAHLSPVLTDEGEFLTLIFIAALDAKDEGDTITITGKPNLEITLKGTNGDLATVAIAVNATRRVKEAGPGLVTMRDLPIVTMW